jgi:hypothetical protein
MSGLYGFLVAFTVCTNSWRKLGEGLGLGFLGILLKPLAGVFDGVIMLLHGVGKTVAVFGTKKLARHRTRKRQPRLFHVDGQLRPVNQEESECQNVITQLGFTDEIFVSNIRLGEYMVIVTSARLILYLWDTRNIKHASRSALAEIGTWVLLLATGLGISIGIALSLRWDRSLRTGGMEIGMGGREIGMGVGIATVGMGIGLAVTLYRILALARHSGSRSKLTSLFQSNMQWQITWSILEAVVLELPPSAIASPTPADADDVMRPKIVVSEVRMRFRLRMRRSCWPVLDVSQTGVVTNFNGLTLQAATPQMFIWDTIRRRRTRELVPGVSHGEGLARLYDVLLQLKIRHENLREKNSGPATVRPSDGLLANVEFTDVPVGPEWEWAPVHRRGVNAGMDFNSVADDAFVGVDEDEDEDEDSATRVFENPFSAAAAARQGAKNRKARQMKQPLFLQSIGDVDGMSDARSVMSDEVMQAPGGMWTR